MRKKDDKIFERKSDKNGVYGNQSSSRKERNKRIRRQKDAGKEKSRVEGISGSGFQCSGIQCLGGRYENGRVYGKADFPDSM